MELISAYGLPYDSRPALERLNFDRETSMVELWENLYHQGDVGSASYAAVPALVDAGELSLVAAIEVASKSTHNPVIPKEIYTIYKKALSFALNSVPSSEEQLQGYYVIHASLNGHEKLAKALCLLCVEEILAEYS
jgi:hypothetical protein